MYKALILCLIAEPFLLFLKPDWHAIYFHTFIPPVIIGLIGIAYLYKKDKTYIEFKLPGLFFAWVFLLCSYRFVGDILARQELNYWPLLPTISIAMFLGLYYILIDTDLKFIDNFIAVVATLMALLAILQYIFYKFPPGWIYADNYKALGTFGNPTNLGAYLAICWVYTARKQYLWGIPLLIAIGLTQSASAGLGVISAILVYSFLRNKKLGLIIATLFLLTGICLLSKIPYYLNPHGKIVVWQKAIEMWRLSPWIGYGPGAFEASVYNDGYTWWCRTHNLIVHILHNYGLIGFAIFVLFCIKVLFNSLGTNSRKQAFTLIVAFGVISLGFIPYHIWPCCVVLAYGLAVLKK